MAHNSDMTQGKPPGSSNFAVPSSTGGDLVYAALKGGLSAVPLVGGNLAEFMQVFFASPIEKRREEWMKQVAHALTHLMAKGLTVESIQSNERFNSAVFQANAIAQRTHRKEKLDALRNALINIALTQTPDETIESIFLGYIDSFTEWHIRILRFYEAPSARSRLTEINQVLEQTFPALKNRPDIYETIWTDLYQKGLVDMQSLHGPIDSSIKNKHATELGKKFLNFIADPVRDTV